jgi:protein required for attachment to host cells
MKAEKQASRLALRHGGWLAVCDGTKGLLIENRGDHRHPKLETREVMTASNPLTHEQGSAKPGRAFSSIDGRRAAVEETDLHLQAEQKFIQNFSDHVERKVHEASIQSIVLIAPARALGILRESLGPSTRHALTGTLARDYVRLSLNEIERHLMDLQSDEEP